MRGFVTALGLSLLLGAGGAASAATAIVDFADPNNTSNAAVVDNADGKVTNITEGTVNAVQTGADGGQFLYLNVQDGLIEAGKVVWVRVQYLDRGTDTWQLEYADVNGDTERLAQPMVTKYDTGAWTELTFKIIDADLSGLQEGGADLRINDNADGAEIIRRVLITDVDPDIVQIPKVDPANPVVIDAVKKDGEWDGAFTVVMDRAEFDVIRPSMFTSKEDFSGTYSFKWNEQGLYVLGEVLDATPRLNTETGDRAWNGDGIELFIALDWSDPSHTTYLEGTDFHLFIGMGDPPVWGNQYLDQPGEDLGPIPAANAAVVNTEGGYNFELLVPWAMLNPDFKIQEGQNIGFYMFANNSTVDPSAQQMAMAPWRRNQPSGNPSRWATAVLSPSLVVENPTAGQ